MKNLISENNTLAGEVKYLRRRNEELSHNDEECQANKAKINQLEQELSNIVKEDSARISQLEGELNTLREQASALHAQKIQSEVKPLHQPDGELQDVDPGAVIIKQPALNGTSACSK